MERQQQQQQPTLCREGCGFFGSAAMEGYCSKCYMDHLRRKQSSHQHATGSTSTVTDSISSASNTVSYNIESTPGQDCTISTINTSQDHDHSSSSSTSASESTASRPKKSRCNVCRKKLGLTGFDCRCGGVYCSLHRYSDTHDCSFDYRENGRQEIAKNNPVVVAQKIRKL